MCNILSSLVIAEKYLGTKLPPQVKYKKAKDTLSHPHKDL